MSSIRPPPPPGRFSGTKCDLRSNLQGPASSKNTTTIALETIAKVNSSVLLFLPPIAYDLLWWFIPHGQVFAKLDTVPTTSGKMPN